MNYTLQKWDENEYKLFLKDLKTHAEDKFRQFNERLMPGTKNTLGIRVPILRDIGKQIAKGDFRSFLSIEKNDCHEEILLEGLVIGYAKMEPLEFLDYLYKYIKKVSNWALCDVAVSTWKIVGKNLNFFWPEILSMTKNEHSWSQRVSIIILLDYYLTSEWIEKVFLAVSQIQSTDYYVRMSIAWLIATAFAKQREKTIEYLNHAELDSEVLKMTAQKIRDSRRISLLDKNWITQYAADRF